MRISCGLAALWAVPAAAEACSCIKSGPPCEAAWRGAGVFAGTVTSIARTSTLAFSERVVTLDVTEAFIGVDGRTATIATGAGGGDCGYGFVEGESYVVYFYQRPDGTLSTSICTRTARLSDAEEDLRYLRALKTSPSSSSIQVSVKFDTNRLEYSPEPARPYGGAVVRIRGEDGNEASAESDANGNVTIPAGPGNYVVSADVPDSVHAEVFPSRIGLRDPRACAGVEVIVSPNGRISGRVVDAFGAPVPHLEVQAGPASRAGERFTWPHRSTRTDAAGRFEVRHLPAGTFLVATNATRSFQEGRFLIPPVFLPGVQDLDRAARVALAASATADVGDLTLPAGVRYVTVSGVVLQPENNLPAAGIRVYVQPAALDQSISDQPLLTDADGRFAIALPADLEFRIFAERRSGPPENQTLQSQKLVITPAASSVLTLTLRSVR